MHRNIKSIALLSVMSVLPAFACGGSSDDDVDAGDTQNIDGSTQNQPDSAQQVTCDRNGFTSANTVVFEGGTNLLALAASAAAEPTDLATMELYYDFGASTETFSHTFANENYADCHTCSVVSLNCTQAGGCEKAFLATTGTAAVTATGDVGDTFTGTLTDVEYVEVTILNEAPFTSTPVVGGETWCIDSLAFSGTIAAPPS